MFKRITQLKPSRRLFRLLTVPSPFVVFALVLAGMAPARLTAAPAASGGLTGYEVIRLGRGHLNRLKSVLTADGTKGLVIVDTGAASSVLTREKFGPTLRPENRQLISNLPATVKANGRRVALGVARQVQIGQVTFGPLAVPLIEQRYLYHQAWRGMEGGDQQYDGLLGEDILRRFRAVLDCGRMALYLNTNPARKLNLGPALAAAGWTRVPMTSHHNNFSVPCEVRGRRCRMIVDTGAPFTSVDSGFIRAAGVSIADTPITGGVMAYRNTPERMGMAALEHWRVGEYVVPAATVVTNSTMTELFKEGGAGDTSSEGTIVGLLGGDFLSANNAMIDIGDHALYLKRGGAGLASNR